MNQLSYKWARFISSRRGSTIIIASWIVLIVILSIIAPGAKPFAVSSGEGSIHHDTQSATAKAMLDEQFPAEDGLVALLIFHNSSAITAEGTAQIVKISEWLSSEEKPVHIANSLPFHQFPSDVQDTMFSEDHTTVVLNAALQKDLESAEMYNTLEEIRSFVDDIGIANMQFEITGPAGIAADTTALFKNADLVLLFSTIGLILLILIIIYRSPLLAIIPLVIAGMVYMVVDRILGLAAQNGWMIIDTQALSIMMILLFAILTDYCLFVLSRFREELKKIGSKHDAMKVAMSQVAEPILFSGSTVLIAVIILFAAIFAPYHNFAPVFSVALAIVLLGGLTLIPAMFTWLGRRAFWPFVPKLGESRGERNRFWSLTGAFVTKRPILVTSVLLILIILASLNATSVQYSFNLMKSFPNDISSRQGFDLIEERFSKGRLAPVTILLKSEEEMELSSIIEPLAALVTAIDEEGDMGDITPEVTAELLAQDATIPRNFLSHDKQTIRLQLILQDNPYERSALNTVENLRDRSEQLLQENGFDTSQFSLHFAGQTAEQLDVRQLNQRDTILIFALITVLISIMLTIQARSLVIGMAMMGTMLLSYTAALGLSWTVFHTILGFDAINYRLPVYTFIFLIALGVDYNIILVSRIREEARKHPWIEAIRRGVSKTGGVISSAGIILAATFSVLMTQPLQELYLFGFTMAIGILIDTFLIRGMLLPALLTLIRGRKQ